MKLIIIQITYNFVAKDRNKVAYSIMNSTKEAGIMSRKRGLINTTEGIREGRLPARNGSELAFNGDSRFCLVGDYH
jgi:hypothetical protein